MADIALPIFQTKVPNSNTGYNTFRELKNNISKPAPGNQIHHIVEQSQIKKSGFDPKVIHSISNVVEINKTLHYKISGYYSGIQSISEGLTFRNWLSGQDFKNQYDWGIKVIEMYKK